MPLYVYDSEENSILLDGKEELLVGSGYCNNWCIVDKVALIQATDEELTKIHAQISGIPFANRSLITTWRAPWAQFIIENLFL